ncbi:four-carbon acid sugar kinase family protein [Labrenzia sp. R4_1]|uniref:3-oxo-tetronate kinase n=1 Tax=Labrenzia sp. R4_1 TaxID=2821106 RepID=UPI001ADD18CA|nr:3-oxo-tetronate kinase [Labrenzia sp. R4_1]MBO9425665.1 four-carbon acid sugar kinase family protein [Labrenzia sp. R4_1]
MKLGVIADDFTGASDIALMLSEAGMQTVQFVGVPASNSLSGSGINCDAGVISLKSRTEPAEEAIRHSLAASDWLISQGCEQIVFKVCSTFDSTDEGNIGPVTQALAERLGEQTVLVCPAFPENGRTVYQGHLFVGDTLLSESGMQNHPLTPMRDPDIRRVLSRQTTWPVSHIPHKTVQLGAASILDAAKTETGSMAIVDAITDEDLIAIGKAAAGRRLVTGGSGIAIGLPANFGVTPHHQAWTGTNGKAVVLSGSCSSATRGQVKHYKQKAPSREIMVEDVIGGWLSMEELIEWTISQDEPPLLYSSADPETVSQVQQRFGREKSASAIENLFSGLAAALVDAGVERIVVAGGETSGAVVSGIKASTLEIGPRIAPGVPALRVAGQPLALALKSGNFGGPDFFEDALHILGAGS